VVRDEVLGALGDPGEVADAELIRSCQRRRQRQPGRIAERASPLGDKTSRRRFEPGAANRLRLLEVEAEKVAAVIDRHENILTAVDALFESGGTMLEMDVPGPIVHNQGVQPRLHDSVTPLARAEWVLLAYRLPREPSTPRIAIWRKLKRLGAAQLLDGLVALPLDSRTRERLEWLADEVIEAGGEATIWVGQLGLAAQERELAARMREAVAGEYRAAIAEAERLRSLPPGRRRRSLARLRRELRRIRARDYFPPAEREQAQRAVEQLAVSLEEVAA
jgi:hypothetical protein